MLPAPPSSFPAFLLTAVLALGPTASRSAGDELEVEVIEVPASEAIAAADSTEGPRPLTLSERFAAAQLGTRYLTRTTEPGIPSDQPLTLFECRELLAAEPGPPERVALVVDLDSSCAYLLINGRMLLETPVFVSTQGREIPHGWLPVTRRVLDGAPAILESPHPTYWLELGDKGVALHAGLMAEASPPSPYCSVRLPRAAMASVFRHLQPGTLVCVCPAWLDSDTDLPLRVSNQGFLPKRPLPPGAAPVPVPVAVSVPTPVAIAQSPLPPLPAPGPVPAFSMTDDADIRQRTLIPVSAAAAIPPTGDQLSPPVSAPSLTASTTAVPDAPLAPLSVREEPPVSAAPSDSVPRSPRLRDLWGTKDHADPAEAPKAKAKPAPAPVSSGKVAQNRKNTEPARLRDLWTAPASVSEASDR